MEEKTFFSVDMIVEVPRKMTVDSFTDLFILFVENMGGLTGGTIKEVDEDGKDIATNGKENS